jgi:hypothetical protein
MPTTLQGLQEVGLVDWPSWYKKTNPNYFFNEIQAPVHQTRMRVCGTGSGHGGVCCGSLHGGRLERRGPGHRGLRERGVGRALKPEELGDQIIARLRGIARDVPSAGEAGNAMVEKAAARVTRNWEDESEDSNDDNAVKQEVGEQKGNLVDV